MAAPTVLKTRSCRSRAEGLNIIYEIAVSWDGASTAS